MHNVLQVYDQHKDKKNCVLIVLISGIEILISHARIRGEKASQGQCKAAASGTVDHEPIAEKSRPQHPRANTAATIVALSCH